MYYSRNDRKEIKLTSRTVEKYKSKLYFLGNPRDLTYGDVHRHICAKCEQVFHFSIALEWHVAEQHKEMTMAVLTGLEHKYPGLEGDVTGSHADIVPDRETGLYSLCFTDTHKKRYKATMEKFKEYSEQLPIISRGLAVDQVLVGFHKKDEAVEAFRQNQDNEEFPELHVAAGSRT